MNFERLRFDFNAPRSPTAAELAELESHRQRMVRRNHDPGDRGDGHRRRQGEGRDGHVRREIRRRGARGGRPRGVHGALRRHPRAGNTAEIGGFKILAEAGGRRGRRARKLCFGTGRRIESSPNETASSPPSPAHSACPRRRSQDASPPSRTTFEPPRRRRFRRRAARREIRGAAAEKVRLGLRRTTRARRAARRGGPGGAQGGGGIAQAAPSGEANEAGACGARVGIRRREGPSSAPSLTRAPQKAGGLKAGAATPAPPPWRAAAEEAETGVRAGGRTRRECPRRSARGGASHHPRSVGVSEAKDGARRAKRQPARTRTTLKSILARGEVVENANPSPPPACLPPSPSRSPADARPAARPLAGGARMSCAASI